MNSSVFVIAPGHDELDHRVKRSFEKIRETGIKSVLYLEENRVTSGFLNNSEIKSYDSVSLLELVMLNKSLLSHRLFKHMDGFDFVYIHDSGLYGVFLIRYINKYFPEKKVVFDYHDYIDWEILHHIGKFISVPFMKKAALKLFLSIFNMLVLSHLKVDYLIGISEGQVANLKARLSDNTLLSSLAIPNTRKLEESNFEPNVDSNDCSFLWVGNLGANRSAEKIHSFIDLYLKSHPLVNLEPIVIGKVWGSGDSLIESFNYLGSYSSDRDIIERLPEGKHIGMFFGWEDEYKLGINKIGSPNKVYSYINLGIPFLIPSSLKNIIDECVIDDSFVFSSDEDFIIKANLIFSDYTHYCGKVRKLKDLVSWDDTVSHLLSKFYLEYIS